MRLIAALTAVRRCRVGYIERRENLDDLIGLDDTIPKTFTGVTLATGPDSLTTPPY